MYCTMLDIRLHSLYIYAYVYMYIYHIAFHCNFFIEILNLECCIDIDFVIDHAHISVTIALMSWCL